MLVRNCPDCNKEIVYEDSRTYKNACSNKVKCDFCRLNRSCPECKEIITYKTTTAKNKGAKKNSVCHKCAVKKIKEFNNRLEVKKSTSERMKLLANTMEGKERAYKLGKGNTGNKYWLGRKMSPEHLLKHSENSKKMWANPDSKVNSKEHRDKLSKGAQGKNNSMYGKNLYDVWIKTHGKEEADKKLDSLNDKRSINTTGKNNPMFGKEPPKGTGIGLSGWYKGWYFRSSLELSYMIRVIERFNLKWESAEKSDYTINYVIEGVHKTYRADFLIGGKYLIEIKPKKMWGWKQNSLKNIAAKKFCEDSGLIYKMRDPGNFTKEEMIKMHYSGIITIENSKLEKIL